MGRVIHRNADAAAQMRDVEITLARAAAHGSPHAEDAENHLAQVVQTWHTVQETLRYSTAALDRARSQLDAANTRANVRIFDARDRLFNTIGRVLHDPVFGTWFPGGAGVYTNEVARNKQAALLSLATLLENNPHFSVPPALLTEIVAGLRAAASEVAELAPQFAAAEIEFRVVRKQYFTVASRGHRELARLKKYWRWRGMTEAQVHELIPHHSVRTQSDAGAASLIVLHPAEPASPLAGGETAAVGP